MKFLLVLAVLVIAVWVWRNNRQATSDSAKPRPAKPPSLPLPMVACLQCGTHLPQTDAVQGRRGSYCCTEHRQQHERESA